MLVFQYNTSIDGYNTTITYLQYVLLLPLHYLIYLQYTILLIYQDHKQYGALHCSSNRFHYLLTFTLHYIIYIRGAAQSVALR